MVRMEPSFFFSSQSAENALQMEFFEQMRIHAVAGI